MSLQPKILRILVPPAAVPSKHASPANQLAAVVSIATHCVSGSSGTTAAAAAANGKGASSSIHTNSGTPLSSSASPATAPSPASVSQRHVSQHPVQPLIAYVLVENSGTTGTGSSTSGGSSNSNHHHSNNIVHHNNKVIVVQNCHTREILFALHWLDLAATVYGETDVKKLPAAAKSLGTIVSLQFYDPSVLFWSRIICHQQHGGGGGATADGNNSSTSTSTSRRWQILVVQTDKRVLLLNLRQGPASQQTLYTIKSPTTVVPLSDPNTITNSMGLVLAHVCEKSVGAVPSSNLLPVSARWLLAGCADGSMKCYDWVTASVVKKIKGLGKGDCVVQLLSANPYNNNTDAAAAATASSSSSSSGTMKPKRILTVTKKGVVYLIELELSNGSIDIQPPTARFQIPLDSNNNAAAAAATGDGSTSMEHTTFSYDAHSDRFQWFVAASSSNKSTPVLYVWNLKSLTAAAAASQQQQQQGQSSSNSSNSSSKYSMLKPEPTLIIQFPAVSSAVMMNHQFSNNPLVMGGLGLLNTPSKDHHSSDYSKQESASSTTTTTGVLMSSASSSQAVTVLSGLVHPAFSEDTVVCVTLTASGDLCLHGAVALAANTTSTVQATPCMGVLMKQAIVSAVASLNEDSDSAVIEQAEFKVHAVTASPLLSSGTGTALTVATNWGLVVLELPVYSNSAVQSRSVALASRYLHFGAGLGSLGKSTVTVQHSAVTYGSLDVLTANPAGLLEPKNPVRLYESPVAQHMPAEFYRRPFRLAPVLMQSPSGVYVCLFWPCEFRYEIMHTASLLQQVGQLRAAGNNTAGLSSQRRNPVVATGTGVCDFCWVSDDDVFAILHAPDLQEQAILQVPKQSEESGSSNLMMSPNLKMIGAGAMGVANLATSVTKTATNATLSATKLATSAAVNTTMTVTKGATNAANKTVGVTSKVIRSGAKGVTKGVKKSFGIFGKKKKGNDNNEGSIMTSADDDDDDEEENNAAKTAAVLAMQQGSAAMNLEALRTPTAASTAVKQRYIELKVLDAVESNSTELSGGIPAATCFPLGELSLRGGNRNAPTVIFGGPVLCVASRSDDDKEGHAHFYTRKNETDSRKASSFQSSGPTLPYPDLVAWDDDGCLCAIVVENRVAVYLSNEPVFELLGTVRIGSPSVPTAEVSSIKFVHGALFCCTWNSVHCVLLGDLEGGICRFDTYLLASTDVPMIIEKAAPSDAYTSLAPIQLALPLVQPTVLGYQSGSLIVSTLRGVQAIPLSSPLMRIGLFLAAGQNERAAKWFDAVPNSDHESLAAFLERRGRPEMALQLPGLSLETIVDVSMRYGYVDRLEDVVETYGVGGLRAIDMGRGVSPSIFGPELNVHSVVLCVGAYLLAHGRVELTRRLATECLRSGQEGKKDAFFLGALLLPLDESDATRLIQRAVAEDGGATDDWIMGEFVRNFVLAPGSVSERT